jgi:hypothetical protein
VLIESGLDDVCPDIVPRLCKARGPVGYIRLGQVVAKSVEFFRPEMDIHCNEKILLGSKDMKKL